MMSRGAVLALLLVIAAPAHAEWRERRAALSEMHTVGEFRIFYSRAGKDALPNVEDANRNGIPDYVDRIARELLAARNNYNDLLRLRHPFNSPRYSNRARFIDVNLLDLPLKPGGFKHGIAYDELSSFDRVQDAGRKVPVLVMDISNELPAKNATPAHELFHLYQYGYTFFKNRWYIEGTARWAERLGKGAGGQADALPRSSTEIRTMFGQTYKTAAFWRRLGSKVDAADGRSFIRAFLEELDRADDTLRVDWKEADQRSAANDIHIWRALRSTLDRPEFVYRWDEEVRALMAIEI